MAQYGVTYSCGHGGTERLFGRHRDRYARLDWLGQHGLCPDCYRAQAREREAWEPPKLYVRLLAQHGAWEVVCWANSYLWKDMLFARGYQYVSTQHENPIYPPSSELARRGYDVLGVCIGPTGMRFARPVPGWRKIIPAGDLEALAGEVRLCRRQGWHIEGEDVGCGVFAALREGRRDLLPEEPCKLSYD